MTLPPFSSPVWVLMLFFLPWIRRKLGLLILSCSAIGSSTRKWLNFRQRLQMVAGMVPETGRDEYLKKIPRALLGFVP